MKGEHCYDGIQAIVNKAYSFRNPKLEKSIKMGFGIYNLRREYIFADYVT